jgi:branched-chain amino acid transport system permease protein
VLSYVIAGLVLGGIYAISAASLTATHRSTGVFNFSFGALAYVVARSYYFLHSEQDWSIAAAGAVALLLIGPGLGVLLYLLLFRFMRLSSTLVKVVATLGLSVCLPPIATLVFGSATVLKVPGLAPEPVRVFHPLGVAVTADQLIVYVSVVVLGIVGVAVLRYSNVGLRVRAMVDSPAMTSLAGTNPNTVSVGVWAVSSFLAGLAGVLSAPIIGLTAEDFTLLMAAAFAAVIAARLRSLPVAVLAGLGMGIVGALVQAYLPPNSAFTAAVLPSIPFLVTALVLAWNAVRGGLLDDSDEVGGALDRAISPQGGATAGAAPAPRRVRRLPRWRWEPSTLVLVVVAATVTAGVDPFWSNYLTQGAALAVVFLSYTLVTGEGGMIWLCQVSFAGVGAVTTAQLATVHGWPVLVAVVVGGLVAAPLGLLIGLLTVRLGPLYVALVTLTFGFLMDRVVFTRDVFTQRGLGVDVDPPAFARSEFALTVLSLGVFCVLAYFIVNIRRSTTGLALSAVRWSEPGARTIGVGVVQTKALVATLAAGVAGLGGGLFALAAGGAVPADFGTLEGVVWLATLMTLGVRSNAAALVAGLTYTLFPAYLQVYLPVWFSPVPVLLFGLGAVYVVRSPQGWLPELRGQLAGIVARLDDRRRPPDPPAGHPDAGLVAPEPALTDGSRA